MSCRLLSQVADGIATLAFDCTEVYNALNEEMIFAFRAHYEALADAASVRCFRRETQTAFS